MATVCGRGCRGDERRKREIVLRHDLICILPSEAAVVQPNCLGDDVVAEPPTPEGEPVLAITGRNAFELFDVVLAATVIRVRGKDLRRALFRYVEILRRFAPGTARSAKRASMGRLFPARKS